MGIIDNLRNFFKRTNDTPVVQKEDPYRKAILASQIVNSIDRIKRINSFDSSIWNLSRVSQYELERKSLINMIQ